LEAKQEAKAAPKKEEEALVIIFDLFHQNTLTKLDHYQ
jgi:uncharacterized protein (UPF0262 family)